MDYLERDEKLRGTELLEVKMLRRGRAGRRRPRGRPKRRFVDVVKGSIKSGKKERRRAEIPN